MKATNVTLLPLVLLSLLAGATIWLDHSTRSGNIATRDEKDRHDPDFIIDKLTTRRFTPDGSLEHTITADKMTHYADDDSTEVALPAVTFFARRPPLQIKARDAWISQDGKEVHLFNNVYLTRSATSDQDELIVSSTELSIFPDDEIARTDTPVDIISGHSQLHGEGLEANNRTRMFTLMGRAHGTIEKRKTP